MGGFFLFLILVLDFAICWGNAYMGGKIWREAHVLGGWSKVVAWATVIQAFFGFTMIFGVLEALLASLFHLLSARGLEASLSLTYLMVIFFILGSGFIITAQSWIVFYRNRSWGNGGVTAWNTFAMGWDTYNALSDVPDAFGKIGDFFFKDDDEDSSALSKIVVLGIALSALIASYFLTRFIMNRAMNTLPAPAYNTIQARQF